MRPAALLLGALLLSGGAAAEDKPVRELDPVHVNAIRNPEVRKYKHILAGLDAFDRHHALAPRADRLRFVVESRDRVALPATLGVRLRGERDFTLPIALDTTGRFEVPRSAAAEDADSELELNQKRGLYRLAIEVKSPGPPENRRRLGDLRLECKVMVAIGKSEMPFLWVGVINGLLLRTDWCSFFGDEKAAVYEGTAKDAHFSYRAARPIREAILVEGNRSALLRAKDDSYEVPIGNSTWSDEAMVELTFADGAPVVAAATGATGTAGETPRTAP